MSHPLNYRRSGNLNQLKSRLPSILEDRKKDKNGKLTVKPYSNNFSRQSRQSNTNLESSFTLTLRQKPVN